MSQTKTAYNKEKIIETLELIVKREKLTEQTIADIGWIKFYLNDMTSECKDCADKSNPPSGAENVKTE